MNKMNKKGFTLIEMLVVIAIIAILVAIVIPTVSSATEKAKEAADAANIRAAISEVTTLGLSTNSDQEKTVTLTQTGAFDKNDDLDYIGDEPISTFNNATSVTVKYVAESGDITFTTSTSGSGTGATEAPEATE